MPVTLYTKEEVEQIVDAEVHKQREELKREVEFWCFNPGYKIKQYIDHNDARRSFKFKL